MAKAKKIRKFLNSQWAEMRNNIHALCVNWDSEKLHDLRLNAKKARAVVSILKKCSDHKKRFSIKKLKELFDHAGKIRTAELNVEALHENQILNKEFEKEQKTIIERESDELCKRSKIYLRDINKLKKRIESQLSVIKNKTISSYYNKNLQELKFNLSQPLHEEHLHDDRKVIKKLLLALKALPHSLQNEINIDEKYLDDLQDKIGKWHDTVTILNMLPEDDPGYQLLNNKKQVQLNEIENLTTNYTSS